MREINDFYKLVNLMFVNICFRLPTHWRNRNLTSSHSLCCRTPFWRHWRWESKSWVRSSYDWCWTMTCIRSSIGWRAEDCCTIRTGVSSVKTDKPVNGKGLSSRARLNWGSLCGICSCGRRTSHRITWRGTWVSRSRTMVDRTNFIRDICAEDTRRQ